MKAIIYSWKTNTSYKEINDMSTISIYTVSLFISFLAGISLFVAFPIYDHYAKFKVSDAANPTCATVPLISSVNLAGSCW